MENARSDFPPEGTDGGKGLRPFPARRNGQFGIHCFWQSTRGMLFDER
ncbi:hypothetical protein AvCA_22540 [Azotobacter vinelandii CA]|uniref:Uncharacterized protein n=2 Tax=Azotobacter vinelandii TaxID=354 RepID=C1DGD4_AZOVD|nr:hypothetical protein Avin_22540 [Azotobacter vinelandii DJ]AGK15010.1 hypothetical protein AvCA_22540 [Azotobacter vinelandii CA]AGK20511.1 hypothetical protein AvCA6_22540 [Azotobacter vinelandii CA6]